MVYQEWSIVFYIDEHGRSPVEEILTALDEKSQQRFRWSIEQLKVRNVRAGMPLTRHLQGDLWELREESRTNIYRLLYVFFTGRRIVFLHAFQKKTQKTPSREIAIAQGRYRAFLARQGGESL
jgi:phage-related protein